eukprot:173904-Pyramimonas_sp.AAC.1
MMQDGGKDENMRTRSRTHKAVGQGLTWRILQKARRSNGITEPRLELPRVVEPLFERDLEAGPAFDHLLGILDRQFDAGRPPHPNSPRGSAPGSAEIQRSRGAVGFGAELTGGTRESRRVPWGWESRLLIWALHGVRGTIPHPLHLNWSSPNLHSRLALP